MTLRQGLGTDVQRIYEQIDDRLDSEDAIIILANGRRALHYAGGFGVSGCHHELLAVQIERAIRGVTGAESVDVGQTVVESEEPSQAACSQAARAGVVLYTRTAIEPRGGGSLLPSIAGSGREPGRIDILDV